MRKVDLHALLDIHLDSLLKKPDGPSIILEKFGTLDREEIHKLVNEVQHSNRQESSRDVDQLANRTLHEKSLRVELQASGGTFLETLLSKQGRENKT